MGSKSIQAEFDEIEKQHHWEQAYQDIKFRSEQDVKKFQYTFNEANRPDNRSLNRYRDVKPYDHSRIVLKRGDCDYINANVVQMERANRRYILTQGPLQNTVGHFWTMVWEQNSRAVLMLNKIIEKKQVKCHMYWPDHVGFEHRLVLTDVDLTVELLRCDKYVDYTKRVLLLSDRQTPGDTREVLQFQYNTWPDFGVPSSPMAFLQFLKQVRASGALDTDVGPPVVHCSAGIGRSGTFCLVDSCLVLFDSDNNKSAVTVKDVLLELRRFRLGLIQTAPQLYFSYKAIIEGIRHFNDPSFNDYEEVPIQAIETPEDECVAPPLPPPRTESLSSVHNSKPLPNIPHSVSVNELDLDKRNQEPLKAANDSTAAMNGSAWVERPLPPFPPLSLQSIDEPPCSEDSENDDQVECYIVDRGDNVHGSDSDDVHSSDEQDDNSGVASSNSSSNESDAFAHKATSTSLANAQNNGGPTTPKYDDKFDANGTLPPSPAGKITESQHNGDRDQANELAGVENNNQNDGAELRRRKRQERQQHIAERVGEIRRLQKEAEEAPKKRRSLMIKIAAGFGFVVGVVCVYAYTKLV